MLYSYGLISKEDLRFTIIYILILKIFNLYKCFRPDFGSGVDDMPECDSDLENEIKKAEEERDERAERIKNGIEHNETNVKNNLYKKSYI